MDSVQGQDLSDLLQQPTDHQEDAIVLDPDMNNARLDFVYEQIAGFMLQLSRLSFSRIGAVSRNETSGQWDVVTRRPLTYDMNELVTLGGCPADRLPESAAPFDHASRFFCACSQSLQVHLEVQRNVAGNDEALAWSQFVARRQLPHMPIPVRRLGRSGSSATTCGLPTCLLIRKRFG
ncbi:hypothetical protein CH35J_003103 [Colletotrichum higginsianum]|uniref:Uncharacterized protein n=1 Tax=Colletotrichum higginsianum TaxID=80884 RepID=A0A4T0WG59_9PEZI|nr:hypothetical protein CH35J_003103 [Colletotrichum higginsianum]